MADKTAIQRIRQLRDAAANLRGATERWREKYRDRKHYDKQGFAFTQFDRPGAFSMPPGIKFEAYVGVYGNSSVSTSWHVDQDVINRFMVKALNQHKQAIFDTIAVLAEQEAAELVAKARQEVADLQALLDEAASSPSAVEAA